MSTQPLESLAAAGTQDSPVSPVEAPHIAKAPQEVSMIQEYQDFVATKLRPTLGSGIDVRESDIHPDAFGFQRAIIRWAVRLGRCAIFADCGLGKSLMQIEWARLMGRRALIFAPLTVAEQTIAEALKFGGVEVRYVRGPEEMLGDGIFITNYERIERFVGVDVDAIVLDESSILKSIDGKTRTLLINEFQHIPFRLCCTATPAPNDIAEIANHCAFLGVKSREEMLATYFVHDADGWRLKGHASGAFYEWMASWAVYLRKPSDLGFSDDGYDLPALDVRQATVACDVVPEGHLFPAHASDGIVGRSRLRRETLDLRVEEVARIVQAEPDQQWIIWTGLNDESAALARALPNAVQVEGNTKQEDKLARLQAFIRGDARVLITKPKVAGFGMNFQHCARMIFCGLGDSWEQYYQCLRRCWRFGQKRDVLAWIVTSDAEDGIVSNVMRKEEEAKAMGDQILANIGELERAHLQDVAPVVMGHGVFDEKGGADWRMIHGDCVDALRSRVASESVHLSVFSPPFANLYVYSDSPRDMGNSSGFEEFFAHLGYLIPELLRVTLPGRLACVHVAQVPAMLGRDGYIGVKDFRGRTIDAFSAGGWIFHREVCIDKDPQAQSIRTNSKALTFTQKNKDRSWSGPALADYILVFRKPGDNPIPIVGDVDNEEWILWARPIWYGIRETETLNVHQARSEKDERHICPLQLGTIERCVRLWSNSGETILSPFAGIGSEGYKSLLVGRRFIGVELKEQYFRVATQNLALAESEVKQVELFDMPRKFDRVMPDGAMANMPRQDWMGNAI